MRFHASVLHMRGDVVTSQPFVSKDGDVLLWNGEIFDGLEVRPGLSCLSSGCADVSSTTGWRARE